MANIRIDHAPTEVTLRELIAFSGRPTVSILLPTHARPQDGVQEATRLKSLLRDARASLQRHPMSLDGEAIEALLAPARALVDVRDPWVGTEGGLALYLGPGFSRGVRLPSSAGASVRVGDRFHVLPLALGLADDERFLVLSLSEQDVRLYRGDRETLDRVDLPDVPTDLEEVAPPDGKAPEELQFHTGTAPGPDSRPAIWHGQGNHEGKEEELARRFLGEVADGVREARSSVDADTPVLLACVEKLGAAFVDAAHDLLVDRKPVAGPLSRPTAAALEGLHAAAWPRVAERSARRRRAALERARSAAASRGTTDFVSAHAAATRGQVDTVWLARDVEERGLRPEQVDALVAEVVGQGGKVRLLDADEPKSGLLATYRFPSAARTSDEAAGRMGGR